MAPFIKRHEIAYPVLLDPRKAAADEIAIQGIPKSLAHDRSGTLVAQAIDMRTEAQFMTMLSKAGLD